MKIVSDIQLFPSTVQSCHSENGILSQSSWRECWASNARSVWPRPSYLFPLRCRNFTSTTGRVSIPYIVRLNWMRWCMKFFYYGSCDIQCIFHKCELHHNKPELYGYYVKIFPWSWDSHRRGDSDHYKHSRYVTSYDYQAARLVSEGPYSSLPVPPAEEESLWAM